MVERSMRPQRGGKRNFQPNNGKPRLRKWEKEVKLIKEKTSLYDLELDSKALFSDYPLSAQTHRGLRRYLPETENATPTTIQRATLLSSLRGRDILAAAKTGSGKTLAFLIPLLEKLWSERWTNTDGPAAIVLSPTRELAMQTYDVLKTIGIRHDFSACLIIGGQTGGKNFQEEALSIGRMNIIIATPGRLCQHLTETPGFLLDSIMLFVLDEADRMLDMGFKTQIDRIISYLPKQRQTLLFSATQTTSLSDLARLSLNDPVYVNTSSNSRLATPATLKQTYCIVKAYEKLNFLYSFIKNVGIKQKTKSLVFMATCKQVMHAKEVLFKLKPGIPLMRLHSKMGQHQRMATYDEFCRKERALLLATDLCARGMDFPGVDWVVQLDCPISPDEYIHRAGRTARNKSAGNSVLCLTPSEKTEMLAKLSNRKPPVKLTSWKVNKDKMTDLTAKLRAYSAESEAIKGYAQRAFVAYCKHIYLGKDKKVFQIEHYKLEKYAASLGLAVTPRLRFLDRDKKKMAAIKNLRQESDSEDDEMFDIKKDETELNEEEEREVERDLKAKEDAGKVKKKSKIVSEALKAGLKSQNLKTFNSDDEEVMDKKDEEDFDINDAMGRLRKEDEIDRAIEKRTKKQKRLEKKKKEKEMKRAILDKDNLEGQAESDDEDALKPETQSFLDKLTVGKVASSDESEDDRDSFTEERPVKKLKLVENIERENFSDETDDEMDMEQLERIALGQL